MAHIAPALKRAAITYAAATASSGQLRAWIAAKVAALYADLSAGRFVSAVSMNGVSTSFADPSAAGLSQFDAAAMWQELLELCDAATAYLGGTPTNAQIAAEMTGRLPTVRSVSYAYAGMQQW